mmetsp:Transcript_114306/g.197606  ORF Transcript_114306/g.197606 Transcript_114306/m.197606 type:complete len:725 (-) Transcript_114306:80-2254(-)
MQLIAFVLASVACAGSGSHSSSSPLTSASTCPPLRSLAKLLVTYDPTLAFSSTSPRVHLPISSPILNAVRPAVMTAGPSSSRELASIFKDYRPVSTAQSQSTEPHRKGDTWKFSYAVGKSHGREKNRDDKRQSGEKWKNVPGTRKGDKAPYVRSEDDEATLTDAQVTQIHKMVDRRLKLRIGQRYDEADGILVRLNRLGVDVSDEQRQWRADGNSFVYKYEQLNADKYPERSRDVEQVEELIHLRGLAKSRKDWDQAEYFLQELTDLGVLCNDKARTWEFDSVGDTIASQFGDMDDNSAVFKRKSIIQSGSYVKAERVGLRRSGVKRYVRSANDKSYLSDEQVAHIEELVMERHKCKLLQEFEEADRILKELWRRDVEVSDEAREWRADGQVFYYRPWADKLKEQTQKEQEAEDKSAAEHETKGRGRLTQEALDELRELVESGDPEYAHSAEVLEELEKKGVSDTGARKYTEDTEEKGPYQRASDCTARLSTAEEHEINKLVADREVLLIRKKFNEADQKSAMLRERRVEVSDYQRLWRVDSRPFLDKYVRTGSAKGRTTEEINHAHELVHLQAQATAYGDYSRANDLLYELSDLGVEVDDAKLTWEFFTQKERVFDVQEESDQPRPLAGAPWDFMQPKGFEESDDDKEQMPHHYTQSDIEEYELEPEMIELVEELIGKRLFAQKMTNRERVAQIDAQLKEMGIEVNDKKQTYYVDDNTQKMFT